jgi:hypothetical protein
MHGTGDQLAIALCGTCRISSSTGITGAAGSSSCPAAIAPPCCGEADLQNIVLNHPAPRSAAAGLLQETFFCFASRRARGCCRFVPAVPGWPVHALLIRLDGSGPGSAAAAASSDSPAAGRLPDADHKDQGFSGLTDHRDWLRQGTSSLPDRKQPAGFRQHVPSHQGGFIRFIVNKRSSTLTRSPTLRCHSPMMQLSTTGPDGHDHRCCHNDDSSL